MIDGILGNIGDHIDEEELRDDYDDDLGDDDVDDDLGNVGEHISEEEGKPADEEDDQDDHLGHKFGLIWDRALVNPYSKVKMNFV